MKNKIYLSCIALALTWSAGCGSDDEMEAELSPAEDACEHMIEGPFESLTAVAADAASMPAIAEDHTRYDIALIASGANSEGFLELRIAEEGEFGIYLSRDIAIEVRDSSDNTIAAEETESVAACSEVSVGHIFDFEVGSYELYVGPSADATEISIVLVELGDHHHEEE